MTDTTGDNAAAVDDFTDDDTTAPPAETQGNPEPPKAEDALGDAGKKALNSMKAELRAAKKELDTFRQASMTEQQKAVHEAETRGRQTALEQYGARLARAQFDALAARRNQEVKTDDIVEFVDMKKFLTEDGDVDVRALQAAVDKLVPEPQQGPPAFDGGPRQSPTRKTMDDIIRSQVGRTA